MSLTTHINKAGSITTQALDAGTVGKKYYGRCNRLLYSVSFDSGARQVQLTNHNWFQQKFNYNKTTFQIRVSFLVTCSKGRYFQVDRYLRCSVEEKIVNVTFREPLFSKFTKYRKSREFSVERFDFGKFLETFLEISVPFVPVKKFLVGWKHIR